MSAAGSQSPPTAPREAWQETNQRLLAAEVQRLRALLEAHAGAPRTSAAPEPSGAPALEAVGRCFGLSPFERDVLVLAAAVELDGDFATACSAAQGDPGRAYPTFGLALAALPDAHWSALSPAAPLRSWRLVEPERGAPLTTAWLRIDETVLHFLAGVACLDARLAGLVEPVQDAGGLAPSQGAVAARLAELWSQPGDRPALVHVGGPNPADSRTVAASAARSCQLALCTVAAADIPAAACERDTLARLWERQAMLGRSALVVECDDADPPDVLRLAAAFAERMSTPVALSGREAPRVTRPLVRLEVDLPTMTEQEQVWGTVLGSAQLNGTFDRVVGQFDLGVDAIRAAGAEARARAAGDGADMADAVWEACRAQARPRLDDLAQRLEPSAGWDDLVLPQQQLDTLREITAHVRHRAIVYDRWGFAARSARGLGIASLFSGPSGTGKTMAGEVLARELRLDLYRIDLSGVVSKYIGETEKNLRRVFDAAEGSGALLLFDEADALFGKRTEVKDSHDRFANIEVSYLLQRIEAYRGLAILTTNLRNAIDQAFLRRIRFIVEFPFPDEGQRREIWARIFPAQAPLQQLDLDGLSRLSIAGGSIRNIGLNAAFRAADDGEPIGMTHLLHAVRSEYAKLGQPLSDAELGSWT